MGAASRSDYTRAVRWFCVAAEQDYAKAQRALGQRYALGQGVAKSDVEGLKWMTLAARQGLPEAMHRRQALLASMSAADVAAGRGLGSRMAARRSLIGHSGMGGDGRGWGCTSWWPARCS